MVRFTSPARNPDAALAQLSPSHVCIRVPDYDAGKQWYIEKLDFRLVHEWPEPMLDVRMCYLAAANDDYFLIEIIGDGAKPLEKPNATDFVASFGNAGFHHLCFAVPDVDATVATLKERDVMIVAEPFVADAINRKLAFFADPFGNLFEIEQVI